MEMEMELQPKSPQIMPLPYRAELGDRLSDDDDCWVIDCEQGSVAEMQCPADVEEATARFMVRAANNHDALVAALTDCAKRMDKLRELMAVSGGRESEIKILDTADAWAALSGAQSQS